MRKFTDNQKEVLVLYYGDFRFRDRHDSHAPIERVIPSLVRRGLLRVVRKGKHGVYGWEPPDYELTRKGIDAARDISDVKDMVRAIDYVTGLQDRLDWKYKDTVRRHREAKKRR